MIPLRCRAAPLQEPLSQQVKPAGGPTEARLLRRGQRRVGHALDTVAFAQESVRQPPSLGAQAKARGRRRRLPGKSPNSVPPVRSDWPRPLAQCFAESLAEDNELAGQPELCSGRRFVVVVYKSTRLYIDYYYYLWRNLVPLQRVNRNLFRQSSALIWGHGVAGADRPLAGLHRQRQPRGRGATAWWPVWLAGPAGGETCGLPQWTKRRGLAPDPRSGPRRSRPA